MGARAIKNLNYEEKQVRSETFYYTFKEKLNSEQMCAMNWSTLFGYRKGLQIRMPGKCPGDLCVVVCVGGGVVPGILIWPNPKLKALPMPL